MKRSRQLRWPRNEHRRPLDTTAEAGPEGCPSGVLYAALMTVGIRLDQYEAIIGVLAKRGRIRRANHLLYWVG
jgi:hypothetical protein